MKQEFVFKVNINCQKCKRDLLKVVAKLIGVDLAAMNGEKGLLTIVGTVDPVCVAEKIRKSGKIAEIISVGPWKPPEPKPDQTKPLPPFCHDCQLVGVRFYSFYDTSRCTIL